MSKIKHAPLQFVKALPERATRGQWLWHQLLTALDRRPGVWARIRGPFVTRYSANSCQREAKRHPPRYQFVVRRDLEDGHWYLYGRRKASGRRSP